MRQSIDEATFRFAPGSPSQDDFADHPVWAWYEEPGDLTVIRRWGVTADLEEMLASVWRLDENDVYFPVLRATLGLRFVHRRAEFSTPTGRLILGVTIDTHAFELWLESGVVSFNTNLEPKADDLAVLERDTGLAARVCFPLTARSSRLNGEDEIVHRYEKWW